MNLVESTEQKLTATIELVQALRASDFPHEHSQEALSAILGMLSTHRDTTRRLSSKSDLATVYNQCNIVFWAIYNHLYLLGLLHRSKSSSNAFELYGPLQRLAHELIGPDIKLVLSSEWDLSPFIVMEVADLPSFVWVGLPASEASNALLTPLAGHEFGHSIWQREDCESTYQFDLDNAIIDALLAPDNWPKYQKYYPSVLDEAALIGDMFGVLSWKPAHEWALSQAEETYCDLVGVRVFGEAFLHAFSYLLAPGGPERGTPSYPSLPARASYLARAAAAYGYAVPIDFQPMFQPTVAQPETERSFFTKIAEIAVDSIVDHLIGSVDDFVTRQGVAKVDPVEVDRSARTFARLVPDGEATSLPTVINAGWKSAHDTTLWRDYPNVRRNRRVALNQLLLKTAQVIEYSHLQQATP